MQVRRAVDSDPMRTGSRSDCLRAECREILLRACVLEATKRESSAQPGRITVLEVL